jgi:hypothetical protein
MTFEKVAGGGFQRPFASQQPSNFPGRSVESSSSTLGRTRTRKSPRQTSLPDSVSHGGLPPRLPHARAASRLRRRPFITTAPAPSVPTPLFINYQKGRWPPRGAVRTHSPGRKKTCAHCVQGCVSELHHRWHLQATVFRQHSQFLRLPTIHIHVL